jgi:YD repeat-containing protein
VASCYGSLFHSPPRTGLTLNAVTDPLSQTVSLSYDALNQPTVITDARGFTSTNAYVGSLLTAQADALGQATLYTYTTAADAPQPINLLKAVSDAQGHTTQYQYDEFGQTVRVTDAAGLATNCSYDGLGRTVSMTVNTPSASLTTPWLSDELGNATDKIDARGLVTRYEYVQLNRLMAVAENYCLACAIIIRRRRRWR